MLFCNFEIIKLCDYIQLNLIVGKKSKSVFDFLTYSREKGFSFSYAKVSKLTG